MKGKDSKKSKVFQIPIEEYEKDMERESSKEKKKEILELFTSYNKLRSKEEFDNIRYDLHDACREGDLKLIKLLLSETIENSSKELIFKIDETNKTASLFSVNIDNEEIVIPRTIKHESTEYLITSIYHINSVNYIYISGDSALETIYRDAFLFLQNEEIYFPESLKELKEGWCNGITSLKKIIISQSNSHFVFKDDKYLIGKSDSCKDEFDTLLFVRRDIGEFSIPSNIKVISSHAFYNCISLIKIEIPTNSNLQIIESNAFSWSKIEEIYFPERLKELKEGWCDEILNLKKIIISPSNDNFIFKDDKYLVGKSDSSKDEFDTLLFVRRDIEEFSIPSNIKIISSHAFQYSNIKAIFIPSKISKICQSAFRYCENLEKVEIPANSNLQTIELCAFSTLSIKSISIPPNVSKICRCAFSDCKNLIKVEIPVNSNLQTIGKYAFVFSNIEEIYFPASLKELEKGWCHGIHNLCKIMISPLNSHFIFKDDKYLIGKSDSSKDEFDTLLFVCRDIEEFSLPPNIKIISSYSFEKCIYLIKIEIPTNSNLQIIEEYAFSYCINLTKVEIPTNSNLQTIEGYAFLDSNIESIFIPSKVSQICKGAFSGCTNLIKVEIPTNSNLQTIEGDAFFDSNIESISIPSKVSKICKGAFSNCQNLQIIEISEESQLESLPLSVFDEYQQPIILIPSSLRKLIYTNISD